MEAEIKQAPEPPVTESTPEVATEQAVVESSVDAQLESSVDAQLESSVDAVVESKPAEGKTAARDISVYPRRLPIPSQYAA